MRGKRKTRIPANDQGMTLLEVVLAISMEWDASGATLFASGVRSAW